MNRILLLCLILLVALSGCEQRKDKPGPAGKGQPVVPVELQVPAPKPIFNAPMTAHRFELPSEALQVWRHTKAVKPALVLFSIHPFLDRVAEERKSDVAGLIQTGDGDTFKYRGSYYRADPALVTTQTLSAAIDNELFSEVIWVIPTRVKPEELSLDVFRKQVVDAGFLTEEEGKDLLLADGVTSGTVRGLPFRAVHPDALPDLNDPVVLHIDTGYFKGLFKNEVASPLYDILHKTVMRIMQSEWDVYSATLSYSTQELMFSLDVRFLISALGKMIEDPQFIQKMPAAWKLHSEAMYMGNMFMETRAQEMIEEAAVTAPDDPAIIYALSQVRFQQDRAAEAFSLLDSTVKLDPGYGTAYFQLAETGIENSQLDKALDLLQKATSVYPEEPFLKIKKADLLIRMKRPDEAISIINELKDLPWSSYFHPQAIESLEKMKDFARNPQRELPTDKLEENK